MTSVLVDAARLLPLIVDEDAEITPLPLLRAGDALHLTTDRAMALIRRVADAGFVEVTDARVLPTLTGVSMGVTLAQSEREVRERDNRAAVGPYWTYVPKEVKLTG